MEKVENDNGNSNKVENIMATTIDKMKKIIDVDSIIGKPITSENGITIIPVSKVSYGLASGGSDFVSKKDEKKDLFGGGSGAGVTILPVAFLVISNDDVKLLQIESFNSTLDRIIAMVPDISDKIANMLKNRKNKKSKSEEDKKI
ncbi:MAG: GerW family sporulation protein [Candidatus Paraimprobicoccus trichonymphae]|uniref:GerW family sporulation protein n=1 Tax=Candidatus Paraimprobicoccus trichonymphae TaxID=3033793 RepID=A0AA48I2A5_9FIRM|nr:MAG: GerW family sporulation protein [Candidatus Paraimprobicoccus trichonymphae]